MLQAVGRCTRGLNDYSAVVVSGGELQYLVDRRRRKYFHPELQAEIEFGVNQSSDVKSDDDLENLHIFLRHDTEWEEANKDILVVRDQSTQEAHPAMNELAAAVRFRDSLSRKHVAR